MSEYKQLPINLRLFQNTVKLLALGAVQYSFRLNTSLHSSQYVASAQCLISLETWNLKNLKVNGFKCIQVHSKHGNFRKKEMIILFLNVSLNTILSTDIYVALEQELCLPSRSEYIRLIAIILDLPSEYN